MASSSTWLDKALSFALTIAALTVAGLYARRELAPPAPSLANLAPTEPLFVEGWEAFADQGIRVGPTKAPVTFVELGDFECPACRQWHYTFRELRQKFPDQVAMVYHHYPLQYHKFAHLAARASECAHQQQQFEQFHNLLYEKQDSIGLKPWVSFARDARVPDIAAFSSCVADTEALPRIAVGAELAKRADLKGTPTILINGWRMIGVPSTGDVEQSIRAVLKGQPPLESGSTAVR